MVSEKRKSMGIWLYAESFIVILLTFYAFLLKENTKFYLKYSVFVVALICVLLLNIVLRDNEPIKIAIYFYLIFLSYSFPVTASRALFSILMIFTTINIAGEGYSKISAIPFILIITLLPHMKVKLGHYYVLLFTVFAFLEILQSAVLKYRGSLLLALALLSYLYISYKYKKHLINMLVYFPLFYLFGMMSYILSISLGYDLPITASNVERSSMIIWGIYNFIDFPIIGPGKELFQMGAGGLKSNILFSELIPNDPHSFIISIFILGGSLLSIVWYIFSVFKVRHINKIINKSMHHYLCVAFPLFITISMHPFNSYSRMITAILFGILLSLSKRAYCRCN